MLFTDQSTQRKHTENRVRHQDRAVHDWYRFVLSYPPHLVKQYLEKFNADEDTQVYDPFCGTGTTIVEAKKLGFPSIGLEANPVAAFASRVKTNWTLDPEDFASYAAGIADVAESAIAADGLDVDTSPHFQEQTPIQAPLLRLPEEQVGLLLANSISPKPLHRVLRLLEAIKEASHPTFSDHARLAVAKTAVFAASNLAFGPEVGLGARRDDAPVVHDWLQAVTQMAEDIHVHRFRAEVPSVLVHGDARSASFQIAPNSVDIVITSPPYPNEKDYTRTTRLESVLLGFLKSKADLRGLKQTLVRSNTRGVYVADTDDQLVDDFPEIQRISKEIEERRLALGKTSGFERLYHRVVKLYFGGMARHLADLRRILRPGARLAYVVGDQASYLRVMIRTGEILATVAESLGFRVTSIDLFRTRLATATGEQLREEVVVLEWPRIVPPKGRTMPKKPAKADGKAKTSEPRKRKSRMYKPIIAAIFKNGYKPGVTEIHFLRSDVDDTAASMGVDPKNLGDLVYSFRYRTELPDEITQTAPAGKSWIIRPKGIAKYCFCLVDEWKVTPNDKLVVTKIPDATPGIVSRYSFDDEQALLTRVRYNRLIDTFLGITCYSLQNHLRTTVDGMGQVETDEIYVGVDKRGAHYVIPVQAKGGSDKIGVVQIEQDFGVCADRFPSLIPRPIAAQFMAEDKIALFEFANMPDGVAIAAERHYLLVPSVDLTEEEQRSYHGGTE